MANNADDEKIRFLREFLLSSLWQRGSDVHWRDLYWEHVRRLSGAHLAVLEFFFHKQRRLSYKQRFELPQPTEHAPVEVRQLQETFTHFGPELIQVLMDDLIASGLLQAWARNPKERGCSISDSGISLMNFLDAEWRKPSQPNQN